MVQEYVFLFITFNIIPYYRKLTLHEINTNFKKSQLIQIVLNFINIIFRVIN